MKDIHFNKQASIRFIRRFHLVVFISVTALLLSIAVLLLTGIVGKASGSDSTAPTSTSAFDDATIERIEKLKTSDEPSEPLDLSQGRINPFSE